MKSVRIVCFSLLGLILLGVLGGAQQGSPDPAELRRIAEALVAQLDLAHQEALFGTLAPHLDTIKLHAQRIINGLQGKNGPDYNAQAGEIGDGVGALVYVQQFRERVRNTSLAQIFMLGLESVQFDLSFGALEQAKRVVRGGLELSRARAVLRSARAFIYSARGSASDPVSEGGARAILARLTAGR